MENLLFAARNWKKIAIGCGLSAALAGGCAVGGVGGYNIGRSAGIGSRPDISLDGHCIPGQSYSVDIYPASSGSKLRIQARGLGDYELADSRLSVRMDGKSAGITGMMKEKPKQHWYDPMRRLFHLGGQPPATQALTQIDKGGIRVVQSCR